MKKLSAIIALVLFALPVLSAQTTTTAKNETAKATDASTLPSKDAVEAAMKRTLGYDHSLEWKILDIQHSEFPGLAEVTVSINKQPSMRLYVSLDAQLAIIGNVMPFGTNPYAATRAKLKAADGPVLGSPTPTIFLVEFSDLECPHCKAAQPVIEKLITDFPQVRYIFQQFPLPATLHPWALKAAEYANCAGRTSNDAFWKYTDSVFEEQGNITADNTESKLKSLATAAGLDADKITACAATPETEARIKKSIALGESLDVTSTPTIFLNGRKIESIASIPYDSLKQLVQFEIDHADK